MILAYIFSIIFLVVADQYSKQVVISYLLLGEKKIVIPNFFDVTYVKNTGAAWSMMEGQQSIFIIISFLAVVGFCYLLIKDKSKFNLYKLSYLLIIGGALGNLIDRITLNYVIDFLDFNIFGYDFPVFNIADSFITIGVFIYVILIILENKNAKN